MDCTASKRLHNIVLMADVVVLLVLCVQTHLFIINSAHTGGALLSGHISIAELIEVPDVMKRERALHWPLPML
jgi:hypothetical protein